MKNVFYECSRETGNIEEIDSYEIAQFITAKNYNTLYAEEIYRFKNNSKKIYALPYDKVPSKQYYGTGRMGLDLGNKMRWRLKSEQKEISKRFYEDFDYANKLMKAEETAIKFVSLFKNSEDYELIWVRNSGSDANIPDGYEFIGYDITYPCEYYGAFSIICDCMFICRWHGCDEEGTLFLPDFNRLNDYGLFDDWQSAYDYMIKYLKEDWSERGTYCIVEIYRKNNN